MDDRIITVGKANEKEVPNMTPKMILLIGIPGSGKSTFFQRKLAADHVRVNLDTLKTRNREARLIDACFAEGKSFCVDNTNLTREERAKYIAKAKARGWQVVGYFMKSVLKDCIARNELRTGDARLPAKAVAAMSNRMELPARDEGIDELFFVEIKDGDYVISEWRDDK